MTNAIVPFLFGSLVLGFSAAGLPDIGWAGVVVTGTMWLSNRLNKIERRIDNLPCNICSVADKEIKPHHR